jgi:hypothetical protein
MKEEGDALKVPLDAWTNLAEGKREPEMESLIEQCVVLGMPEHYRCDGA